MIDKHLLAHKAAGRELEAVIEAVGESSAHEHATGAVVAADQQHLGHSDAPRAVGGREAQVPERLIEEH